MKVILLQDISKVGKRFEVKELPNGYASHLIRLKKAELATDKKMKNIKQVLRRKELVDKQKADALNAAIEKVKASGIKVIAKANDEGTLFEGITAVKLQEVVSDTIAELPITSIKLDDPIKEVGEYEIVLTDGNSDTKVKLSVIAERR